MQIDHRCNMAMTTQNWCVEIEEDNAWANEIGIDMHYPRYLVEPDEFREAFKTQMLGILAAACTEQKHGLTEEEITEAVGKAKRNEEAVTAPKKTFQPRENRQYQPQSKKASEERIQPSDADRALFQDKPASTSITTSQMNRKNSPATTQSNPPRNMYLAPKGETNKAQQRQEGQNYTTEEESSGDEQGGSRHSKQMQPPQTKPSWTRGPAQDDDRLPVEEDRFDVYYSQMNDEYVELPRLDQPSYNQQQESQYQNQPHIPPQNHARNIDDYFDGTAQQMMFDNPAQFNQPVQSVRDSARQFAPIQNPNDSHGSQRRSHGPHQGVPAQNQSTYNQSPRVANVPTDLVSSNSPYGYGELPFVQGNYSPEQRYQGNNIAQPTSMAARPASQRASRRVPQRGDSSTPGHLSVSNHDLHQSSSSYVAPQRIGYGNTPRLGSSSSAFQQVMSKRSAETQTPYEMLADYQLKLSGPRDKRDVMVDAIISMVQLHDENNQDLRLSNLGSKLSAFCGVEVSPKDFHRENWAELQPFRAGDFHVFFIKDG
ncbi:unnamed protein product, partial [Mesorhabditis belari]|uniref:Uncharacterized protein n=1 Tax=Mesorhabditis belari TaxID=2138241 RepID=A0AAF3J3K0_9BILA